VTIVAGRGLDSAAVGAGHPARQRVGFFDVGIAGRSRGQARLAEGGSGRHVLFRAPARQAGTVLRREFLLLGSLHHSSTVRPAGRSFGPIGLQRRSLHHHERELTEPGENRTRLNRGEVGPVGLPGGRVHPSRDLRHHGLVRLPAGGCRAVSAAGRRRSQRRHEPLQGVAALNPAAFENWKTFSRHWLEHVNPYTQRAYKDEPGVAWLALINEGNLTNFVHLAKDIPDYQQAWNRWLLEQYGDRAALAEAWGSMLGSNDHPLQRHGAPGRFGVRTGSPARDLILFSDPGRAGFPGRAMEFLRDELGVKSLVTNMNGWTNHVGQPASACRDGLCGRSFLRRSPAVSGAIVAAAQPVRQRQPGRGRSQRRTPPGLHPVAGQAVHGLGVQLFGTRTLSRRRRDLDRRVGSDPGLGCDLAVCLQPQPRQPVPTGPHGLLQHGLGSAQPGSRAGQHLSVPAPGHAAGAAQRWGS
jgi:hypothetical protein